MSLAKLASGFHLSERPADPKTTLRRALAYVRPYRRRLAVYAALLAGSAGMGIIPPLLFRRLIDDAIPRGDLRAVNILLITALLAYLGSTLLLLGGGYFGTLIGTGIIRDLRQALFDHLQRLPMAFFVRSKTGEVQSRLNNDVVNAQQMFTGHLFSGSVGSAAADVLTLSFTLGVMFTLSWPITLAALVLAPVLIISSKRIGVRVRQLTREQMSLFGEMNSFTQERFNVAGALLVKLFGTASRESGLYRNRISALRHNNIRVNSLAQIVTAAIGFLGVSSVIAVYWSGAALAITGSVTIGTVVAMAAYAQRAYTPLLDLSSARINLLSALVSFERVFEVLDTPIAIAEPEHPCRTSIGAGSVQLDDVSFRYHDGDESAPWALRDIDLAIPAGAMTALVGASGAGKTTLCMLIARLYDPSAGSIRIDGTDVRDYPLAVLAREIGVVTQDAHFFHESVRDNLRFAKPEASDAEMVAACEAASIHGLVTSLPDGYDTIVGERGYRFSGGEKQRLALARVILRDPRIVILDEATAHLDTRTEQSVQRALDVALAERTAIVIAHRLSTIERAEQIVVIADGEVVATGRHEELLRHNAVYTDLYHRQYATHPVT